MSRAERSRVEPDLSPLSLAMLRGWPLPCILFNRAMRGQWPYITPHILPASRVPYGTQHINPCVHPLPKKSCRSSRKPRTGISVHPSAVKHGSRVARKPSARSTGTQPQWLGIAVHVRRLGDIPTWYSSCRWNCSIGLRALLEPDRSWSVPIAKWRVGQSQHPSRTD
jgi:hypothetical protein